MQISLKELSTVVPIGYKNVNKQLLLLLYNTLKIPLAKRGTHLAEQFET